MENIEELVTQVTLADLEGDIREIADLTGIEAAMKLVDVYGGTRLYIPVLGQVLIPVKHRHVLDLYYKEGKSVDDIRRETRYGESTIREILFKNGDPRQGALFEGGLR